MRLSLSLPLISGESDWEEYDQLLEFATTAERAGADAVSTTDHPFPVVSEGRAGHHALDPFVLLSVIGGGTQSIRLHFSLLVAPYRNPFLLARQISSLDVLTKGRCLVALGAGYLPAEFAALGADLAERPTAVENTLDAMELAWSGEPVAASGQGWAANGNVMRPRPYSSPRPTIWRGGNSRKALHSAVARFDGWTPFEVGADWSDQTSTAAMTMQTLPGKLEEARRMANDAGRDRAFDICFVRTSTRWLSDAARASDELALLADAGLDWLEVKVFGRTHAARLEGIHNLMEIAKQSCVRPAIPPVG